MTQTDTNLTMSGDLLGTLRYMSPEQVEAKHGVLDHRTDVYSLGLTLYELPTLQPTFPGDDRQKLCRQIAEHTPRAPRQLNHAIPRDLETIVLKATAKEPNGRYTDAEATAEDLRRFLAGRLVKARRPGTAERIWRWCCRNPAVAALGTSLLVALVLICAGSLWAALWLSGERGVALSDLQRARQAERRARRAEREAKERLWEAYLAQARANRRSGRSGQRFDSLKAIAAAAAMRPAPELRNEAIACMALADLRVDRQWDLETNRSLRFDSKLEHYMTEDAKGDTTVRRVADDRELFRIPRSRGRSMDGQFSPDGRLLAEKRGSAKAAECRIGDLRTRQVTLQAPIHWRGCTDFGPDGRTIALGQSDGSVHIYDPAKGTRLQTFSVGEGIQRGRFGPTGRQLALFRAFGSTVQLLDREEGKVVRRFPHPATVHDVAWCPDGKLLAVGCADHNIHMWDTQTGRQRAVLRGHQGGVVRVAFHPAGEILASCSYDATSRLWHPTSGEQLVRTSGEFVRFSQDGRRSGFATGGSASIWKVATGRECRTLHEPVKGRRGAGK